MRLHPKWPVFCTAVSRAWRVDAAVEKGAVGWGGRHCGGSGLWRHERGGVFPACKPAPAARQHVCMPGFGHDFWLPAAFGLARAGVEKGAENRRLGVHRASCVYRCGAGLCGGAAHGKASGGKFDGAFFGCDTLLFCGGVAAGLHPSRQKGKRAFRQKGAGVGGGGSRCACPQCAVFTVMPGGGL